MSEQNPELIGQWQRVTDVVKEKVLMPALWRALERARPITLEDGQFVVGFRIDEALDSHLLTDVRHRNIIEQTLEELAGHRVTLRVLQGDTYQDWVEFRDAEKEAARLRGVREKPEPVATDSGWDSVGEKLVRGFMSLPHRQLPNVTAEFLDQAVGALAQAYGQQMGSGTPDDSQLRSYGRVLDRLSDRMNLPAAVLGYLVIQRRKQSGG